MELGTFFTIVTWGLALSGWGKIIYDHMLAKPKISGRILAVEPGVLKLGGGEHPPAWCFAIYAHFVNSGKNAAHIIDVELSINFKCLGWKRITKVYGAFGGLPINKVQDGRPVTLNITDETLLYKGATGMQFGVLLHGWVIFAGNLDLEGREVLAYRLTCVDVFGGRHVTTIDSVEELNPYILNELADVKFSPAVI